MQFKVLVTFALAISLLLSAYFIKSTLDVYKTRSRIDDARAELQALKQENTDLKRDIEYRKTDDFVINEAREKLNYSFEGEQIVVVPKSELEKNKKEELESNDAEQKEAETTDSKVSEPIPVQWVKVFL